MNTNENLAELSRQGVAVWLDDLSRERIVSDDLQRLIDERSVVGVTTNPSIFQAAIGGSDQYDDQIRDSAILGMSVDEAVRSITTRDVRAACDVLRPIYEASGGRDGRVSIEVDPRSAHDEEKTTAEAALLWWMVDRPNLFIKIPATDQGIPAIADAIAAGISVNVTLIFSLARYQQVMDAYISGIERRLADGGSVQNLESVASFFVSRVDTEIDDRLEKIGGDAAALKGKAGVANAQLAYEAYEQTFGSDRWARLEAQGARRQRPLWASTGVKNPDYPDTLYVSELIAEGTVNTMPEKTLEAYADHGSSGTPITRSYAQAHKVMDSVSAAGVDLTDVFAVLEREGVAKFETAWAELYETVSTALSES
ncbi:transaldolase [Blastococcus sp. Marseille-P5729]|uniref:transaldolase n=1 Tax=Blastococcus sp. Marseille-P5729 TaxID=2086582 RepID=UPI000D0F35AA|nr:transaldolase [Blastococcus sp. Marseille-P5729]